jgi:hypothetical protein
MRRNRLMGLTVQAIAASLLLAACKMPFIGCKPSTLHSLPDTLDPCSPLIDLRWGGWVETPPTPEFTLTADGTVYYKQGQGKTMVAHLTPEETLALVQRVLDLGFECLEDGEPCRREPGLGMVCLTDQSFWYLAVRLPNGELKGIHDYYEIVDSPAGFTRIQNELMMYLHPEAQPYTSPDMDCGR